MQKEIKGEILKASLHGFGDAGEKAYCATVYIVHETSEGAYSTFVCSKTRISPLKQLFIPRLEPFAGKIITTLMDTVIKALGPHTKIDEIHYWTDCMTVLYWIQNMEGICPAKSGRDSKINSKISVGSFVKIRKPCIFRFIWGPYKISLL